MLQDQLNPISIFHIVGDKVNHSRTIGICMMRISPQLQQVFKTDLVSTCICHLEYAHSKLGTGVRVSTILDSGIHLFGVTFERGTQQSAVNLSREHLFERSWTVTTKCGHDNAHA